MGFTRGYLCGAQKGCDVCFVVVVVSSWCTRLMCHMSHMHRLMHMTQVLKNQAITLYHVSASGSWERYNIKVKEG